VSSPVIRRRSTHGPPHEQLLVRLGAGGASLSVVHRCRPRSFVVPQSFVVCRPLGHLSSLSSYGPGAPTIHPTSSCSSAWGWVLCRSSSLSMSSLSPVVVICCCCLLSSFVVVVVHVVVVPHCCHLSLSPVVVICCRPPLLSFVVVVVHVVVVPRPRRLSSSFVVLVPVLVPVLVIVPPAVHPMSSCL
jgi:hypothetical protein